MFLLKKDLQAIFNPTYLQRGRDYVARGMVLKTDSKNEGELITASVRGSGRKTYHAEIYLDQNDGKVTDIHGHCSCPVHYNCKHVAAALLHYIEHQPPQQDDLFGAPVGGWLEQLKAANQTAGQAKSPANRLLFILELQHLPSGNRLMVKTLKAHLRKDGNYAAAKPFSSNAHSPAASLSDDDRHALSVLQAMNSGPPSAETALVGVSGAATLQVLMDSGRCHWKSEQSPALQFGEDFSSPLSWHSLEDGSQVIRADQLSAKNILLPLVPPYYLNTESAQCGVLQTGLPDKIAAVLVASPAVAPANITKLCEALKSSFKGLDLPLPIVPEIHQIRDIQPTPCLRLFDEKPDFAYFGEDEIVSIATLHFDYQGTRIHPHSEEESFTRQTEEGYEVLHRNLKFEKAALHRLDEIGLLSDEFSFGDESLELEPAHVSDTWVDFMLYHREALLADGWNVEIDDNFSFHLDEADEWYANIEQSSNDWFKLELGVDVDGEQINLLPFLVSFLSSLKGAQEIEDLRSQPDDYPLLLQQNNGRMLHVPLAKVRHIIDTLVELYDPNVLDDDGNLELSRYHSNQLSALDSVHTDLVWQGGEKLRKFGERLQNFEGIRNIKPPATLKADLRDYQKEGLNWLQFLRKYELGGILADDMGLGKTVQALAHLLVEKKARRADLPSLVVAPTSLMVNWKREAERFAPSLKVLVLQGMQRKQYFDQIAEHDLVLTTYPLLSRDTEVLMQQPWHIVILDEAQHIKNPKSKAAQTACHLNTRHRLCLTGTPLENHLGELWSQFNFLMPGMLGDERRFRKIFRTPIEKHQDSARQQQLRQRVAPFMIRRDKSEVATELPPKTEMLTQVELSGAQRDLYETIRVSMHNKVKQAIDKKGISRSQIIILDALLKLRQVCCHPQLLKLPSAQKVKHSAKLDQLMEMLPEMVEEGRRILLFSAFTSMLAMIEDELKKNNIHYVKLTGQTRNREKPIDEFQSGKVPVFLISLKAGGSGLNLTAADTVIHYDPWWNPAAERQATDRAYRIGQDKSVFVYKMITAGTVEEKIAAMQAKKQALADALFAEGSKGGSLSSEDLQALFQPLGG